MTTDRIQSWVQEDTEALAAMSPEERRAFSIVSAGIATEEQMDAAGGDLVEEIKSTLPQFRVRTGGEFLDGEEKRVKQNDDGSYPWVFSDESIDRDGDIITAKGWDLRAYRKNPVILFGHGRETTEPIGRAANVRVTETKNGPALVGDITFAKEESELASRIERLVAGRFLTASSVGFLPTKIANTTDEQRVALGLGKYGVVFEKQELMENSIVSVPSNPNALRLGVKSGSITEADADLADACMTERDWERYLRGKSRSFVSFASPPAAESKSDDEVVTTSFAWTNGTTTNGNEITFVEQSSLDLEAFKKAMGDFAKQAETSNSALRDALLELADGQKMVARALTHLRLIQPDDKPAADAGAVSDVGKDLAQGIQLEEIAKAVETLRSTISKKD